ncbi:hypothetical protein EPUL_002532 [Erysiphe pulchra]|uniref:Uncharacterized protein n=1 Tax=Erysiphe pulchra TaxID=225359 RepID=A0A2S4PVQ4_9PEZI|nr:hypothetical protein EPUL_002532 [Erysiphe pulchra]
MKGIYEKNDRSCCNKPFINFKLIAPDTFCGTPDKFSGEVPAKADLMTCQWRNFFPKAKDPDGKSSMADFQALHIDALGERGQMALRGWRREGLCLDDKAHTITGTYNDGMLKMFSTHAGRFQNKDDQLEYYMCLINSISNSGNIKGFRMGQGTSNVKVHENDCLKSDSVKHKTKYIREAPTKEGDFTIASVTISDINKALEKLSKARLKPTLEIIHQKLPQELHGLENLFLEGSSVPPHRPGHDMEIVLEDDKIPPYGPLDEISREELLVLREIRPDLSDKGWIRASSSPASSPVLFAK